MTAATVSRPVGTAGPGDHLCLSFASDTEQHELTTAFVRKGLADGEKVFYFTDTTPAMHGARALVLAAENLADGRRLVLDSAPRELTKFLRLTGWDRAMNVVVGE